MLDDALHQHPLFPSVADFEPAAEAPEDHDRLDALDVLLRGKAWLLRRRERLVRGLVRGRLRLGRRPHHAPAAAPAAALVATPVALLHQPRRRLPWPLWALHEHSILRLHRQLRHCFEGAGRRFVLCIRFRGTNTSIFFCFFPDLLPLLRRRDKHFGEERHDDELEDLLPCEEGLSEVLAYVELARQDGGVRHESRCNAAACDPAHVVRYVFGVEHEEEVNACEERDAEDEPQPEQDVYLEISTARAARFHLGREGMLPQPVETVCVIGEIVDHEGAEPRERRGLEGRELERPDGRSVVRQEPRHVALEQAHDALVVVLLTVPAVAFFEDVHLAARKHARLRRALDEVTRACAEQMPGNALVRHVVVDLHTDGVRLLGGGARVSGRLRRVGGERSLVHLRSLVQHRADRRPREEELHHRQEVVGRPGHGVGARDGHTQQDWRDDGLPAVPRRHAEV